MSGILTNLAAGELEEQVLEIGRAVQGAQLGMVGQGSEQGAGVLGVEEHGLAADLDARGELVARIDSYECTVNASLQQSFRRNRLAPREAVASRR